MFCLLEGRACAVVFDCKFIETSASLNHNVQELFEGIVRHIRLRRDSKETNEHRRSIYKCKESFTKKARRFLDKLVAKNNKKMALKVRSKSCHDLAVLWALFLTSESFESHQASGFYKGFFVIIYYLFSFSFEESGFNGWHFWESFQQINLKNYVGMRSHEAIVSNQTVVSNIK